MPVTFKSQPNMFVKINSKHIANATGMKGIYFDSNGEYTTDNEILIKALSNVFTRADSKMFVCKKCGEEFDNKGKFLAHSRTHSKE